MSFKRLLIVAVAGFIMVFLGLSDSRPAFAERADAVILYEDPALAPIAETIAAWGAHFDAGFSAQRLEKWMLEHPRQAEHWIVLGPLSDPARAEVGSLADRSRASVFWIGTGDFHSSLAAIGFEYQGQRVATVPFRVSEWQPDDGTDYEVVAEATDGLNKRPLIVKQGRHFYAATDMSTEPVRLLVAGVLHDFLGIAHDQAVQGLIIIDNVHPEIGTDRLKHIADALIRQRLPFLISVIPIYEHPETGKSMIRPDSEWMNVIRSMVEHGGTVVLDGFAHREAGNAEETHLLFERELAVLLEAGLYPIAFHAYGENLGETHLDAAKGYFSTVFPNAFRPMSETAELGDVLRRLDQLRMVRDAFINVNIDPSTAPESLEEGLGRLLRANIQWLDLRYESHTVKSDFFDLRVPGNGLLDVRITAASKLKQLVQEAADDQKALSILSYVTTWTIAVVVAVFLLMFAVFVAALQWRRRRRLFSEHEEVPE